MNEPCPWGEDIIELKVADLTAAEKMWLVTEIVSGRSTAAILSHKYQIRRGTIVEWVRKFRKGVKLQGREGRPRRTNNVETSNHTNTVQVGEAIMIPIFSVL